MLSRKRRKLDTENGLEEYFGDVLGELDLEISIRRRLAETLESRITWALVLQEALQKGGSGSTTSFKDAAFDAVSAIETPLDILFTRDISPVIRNSTPLQAAKLPRPTLKQKHAARNPNANFLYIKSSDLQPPYDENHVKTYLLRCPTCLRKTFTSLQGLLNHARISHGLEWGTHDECVRACAVVVSDLDTEAGIEVGLGPSGILPGLRSLFQMAVGTHQPDTTPTAEGEREVTMTRVAQTAISSHLVRTLGLHEDTPALAPFLGKQATRREIKVAGSGDEIVDVDSFEDEIQGHPDRPTPKTHKMSEPLHHTKHTWRMRFTHRNDCDSNPLSEECVEAPLHASSATSVSPDPTSDNSPAIAEVPHAQDVQTSASTLEANLLSVRGSRFQFAARVIVMDRSLWIPPDRRSPDSESHTHKWMISVDSPSYSHHITTILQRLTVSSLSDPPGSSAITTASPPFVVVGTTDQPFLAKVELCFRGAPNATGDIVDQTTVLEHWVELDPLGTGIPVVGDEQVVDIDLDKRTILLPIQTGYTPVGTKSLWSMPTGSIQDGGKRMTEPAQGYEGILNSLLGNFPMTLKDVKNPRSPPILPYKLVATPAQLNALVHGRRKAIEWARAHALRDAYAREIEAPQFASQCPISLTTADVFTWLAEQGHLPKRLSGSSKAKQRSKLLKGKVTDVWCPTCGQRPEAHMSALDIKTEGTHSTLQEIVKPEEAAEAAKLGLHTGFSLHLCDIAANVTKIPMANSSVLLARLIHRPPETGLMQPSSVSKSTVGINMTKKLREADLVAASDPQLTLAIRETVRSLKLPSVATSSWNDQSLLYPLDQIGPDKDQVETELAAYATLAICTKQFLRVLIEGGLEVARKDKIVPIANVGTAIKKRRRKARVVSVLTPAHILRSIALRSKDGGELELAVSGCLAPLGVSMAPDALPADDHNEQDEHHREGHNEDIVMIKQELEDV